MQREKLLSEFNGKKIQEARKIRNVTLEELAEHLGISHQAVSKYENNKATPNIETIAALSQILGFEPSFFYTKEISHEISNGSFIYRSKASVAKKYKDQTESHIGLINLVIRNIKSKIKIPSFDTSLLKHVDPDVFQPTDDDELEALSLVIRSKVNFSDGPIGNLTALCEKLGLHIVYLNLNHQGIDACSVLLDNAPFIILNKGVLSSVRIRFSVAHELAHILLHSQYSNKILSKNSKRMEYEANRLGLALLLPETGFVKDLTSLGLDYLLILKKHWLVSVQALIYRAEQLELFTPDYCLYLRQQISRKGWRYKEPFDETIPKESPKLLTHALTYLQEKMNISLSQISFETGVTEKEIIEFCAPMDDHSSKSFESSANHYLRRIK